MKRLILTTLSISILISGTLFSQGNGNGNSNSAVHWKIDGNTNTPNDNRFIGTVNSAPLVFKTDGVERMRLTASGNLGFGIDHPEAQLDINGDVRFRQSLKLSNLSEYTGNTDPAY